jgi:hypothetical protein
MDKVNVLDRFARLHVLSLVGFVWHESNLLTAWAYPAFGTAISCW